MSQRLASRGHCPCDTVCSSGRRFHGFRVLSADQGIGIWVAGERYVIYAQRGTTMKGGISILAFFFRGGNLQPRT